jgi:hypothetical protein
MTFVQHLPEDVVDVIRKGVFAEFATVSSAGVPIDTPTFFFQSADWRSIDVATGLGYPAKAERARRNPKVGLLIEGGMEQPVVSIAGLATVRDADLQANLDRYLAETIFSPTVDPQVVEWSNVRKMRWYLPRIIVCVGPVHVRWWQKRSAMDEPPDEWRAPLDTVYPPSDPAPKGKPSEAPKWPQPHWRELIQPALAQNLPGHLTLLDAEGFPLPVRVREIYPHPEGFRIHVPKAAPWSEGKATLSFVGKEIFVGEATKDGTETLLRVERTLPISPLVSDRSRKNVEDYAKLLKRVEEEAARRGQAIPVAPEYPPAPTEGAKGRAAAMRGLNQSVAGGGVGLD